MPMNFTPSERKRLLSLINKFRKMKSTLPNFEYGKNNITRQYQRLEHQKRRSCPRKIHIIANTSLMPWLKSNCKMRNKKVKNIARSMKHNSLSLSPIPPMFKQSIVKNIGGTIQRRRVLNKKNNDKIFIQTVKKVPNGNLTVNRNVYRKNNNKSNVVYLTKTKKPILISDRNKPYVLSSSGKRSYNPKAVFIKRGNIISKLQ